jgi:hypothetical protein
MDRAQADQDCRIADTEWLVRTFAFGPKPIATPFQAGFICQRADPDFVRLAGYDALIKRSGNSATASSRQLTLGVVAINGWNRLNVAFRTPAGNYKSAIRRSAA